MFESENEREARTQLRGARRAHFPAPIERMSCGPLPRNSTERLEELRWYSPQNPGSEPPPVFGAWKAVPLFDKGFPINKP
jgi:hypothetical protein